MVELPPSASELVLAKIAYESRYRITDYHDPFAWNNEELETKMAWVNAAKAVCDAFMQMNVGNTKPAASAPRSPSFGTGVGRQVHYVDTFGSHCAATVIAVQHKESGMVALAVFLIHGVNEVDLIYPADVEYDAACAPRTWHWPESVE